MIRQSPPKRAISHPTDDPPEPRRAISHPTDDLTESSHDSETEDEHDPLDDSLPSNTSDVRKWFEPQHEMKDSLFYIDLNSPNDFHIELPIPEPFEGWIYKRSRYIKTWRKRFCVISLKHCRLSTYPVDQKTRCTESLNLQQYDIEKVYDVSIINKLKGDLKSWNEFVLVPLDPTIDSTFLFCEHVQDVGMIHQIQNG